MVREYIDLILIVVQNSFYGDRIHRCSVGNTDNQLVIFTRFMLLRFFLFTPFLYFEKAAP